ncbi:Cro/CI family transcriptional regulator [Morganella morganii]|uniref:Cro/CI family transcriptional regulator n=1 Tax=Morganella morganii TaxID=582 RepID=UPI001BDA76CE|nr:Cro/CI family transcriptional regulator [Morganella morganii]MBT0329056.1 helix-turn-helix domain-containing protein [Morganella morganii subsp. morganii]MBT0366223.1 helix-turn-helix domain-containing protein [Morganella morganii subsp. morganii]MCU6376009.1 Cro/Cl family transcriptional regulator [Morganella morganii]HEG4393497.1 helix-turn-helix domain-containing protein [Morganella morganii]
MKKEDVINYFGGICKTADALGIKHPSVSGWDEVIPKGRAYEIEKLTNGKLKYNSALYQHSSTEKHG